MARSELGVCAVGADAVRTFRFMSLITELGVGLEDLGASTASKGSLPAVG